MLIYSFITDYQAFNLRYKDNTTRDKNETKVDKQSANLGKNNEPIQNRLSFLIDCKSVILHHLAILSFPMVRPAWDNWWLLVASAGVSYNKFLAKIASDYRKPDGLCTIHPDQALEFIARLPIESFWGVGPVTAKKMHALGIHNGEQLRACSQAMLMREFGKVGGVYYDFARGIDLRPVEAVRVRKSVGCEHTLEKDINRRASVIIELYHAAVELVGRLEHKNFRGNTLTLKIKFHDFSQITRSITQSGELTTLDAILPLAKQLLKEVDYEHHPIRLIGLSVSNPREENDEKGVWEQLSFEFRDWEFDK